MATGAKTLKEMVRMLANTVTYISEGRSLRPIMPSNQFSVSCWGLHVTTNITLLCAAVDANCLSGNLNLLAPRCLFKLNYIV